MSINDSRKTSVSVTIATAGVALAVAIMLLTIAVTAGFKNEIRNTITAFDGDMSVVATGGEYEAKDLNGDLVAKVEGIVKNIEPCAEVSGMVTLPAMLKTADNFEAVMLRAYTPESDCDFLKSMIVEGNRSVADSLIMYGSADMIVISTTEASRLGLKVGDKVNTVFFDASGNIRVRNPRIAALYCSYFSSYDTSVGFANKALLDEIAVRGNDEWDQLVIDGVEFDRWRDVSENLRQALWQEFVSGNSSIYLGVNCVLDTSAQFFSWLELLDTNVVVIIVLMSLIGLFTLTATLFILILERTRMIGTFKTMGASNMFIRKVFILLIGRIVARGLLWGNIVAVAIIMVQYFTHILPLDPEAYFISYVPVKLELMSLLQINLAAIAVSVLAMIVPSSLIARFTPAKTLRFE